MKKKISFSLIIFVFCFVAVGVVRTNAANITGWLWGGTEDSADAVINGNETGVGWISMNGDTVAGGVDYNVVIPTADGDLSGYAYSENIGWISFNPADVSGCPSGTCNARREGNNLNGWARIMSIVQAGANSGGWLGWVKLKGNAQDGSPYGVSILNGNMTGMAWSNELGWLDFSRAGIPLPPVITFSGNPLTINIDNNPLPEDITLTWSVTGATGCTASSTNGSWTGSKNPTSGTESTSITTAAPLVTFTLTCVGDGGTTSETVDITTVCYNHSCGSGTCNALPVYGIPTSASCSTQSCSTNAQCQSVSTGTWMEVAP